MSPEEIGSGSAPQGSFQRLIEEIYFDRDKDRGTSGTLLWFVEEVGERLLRLLDAHVGAPDEGRRARGRVHAVVRARLRALRGDRVAAEVAAADARGRARMPRRLQHLHRRGVQAGETAQPLPLSCVHACLSTIQGSHQHGGSLVSAPVAGIQISQQRGVCIKPILTNCRLLHFSLKPRPEVGNPAKHGRNLPER